MKRTSKYLNQWSRKDFLRLPEGLDHSYTSLIIFPTKEKCMGFWVGYVLVGCVEGVPTEMQYCEDVAWSCPKALVNCLRKSKAFHFRRRIEQLEDRNKKFHIIRSDNNFEIELF